MKIQHAWTPAMQARLLELLADPGMTYSAVADILNQEYGTKLTKNSCIGRGRRLGVPQRPAHYREPPMPVPMRTPPPQARPRPAYDQYELEDLALDTCRWPIGEANDFPPYHYCGRQRVQGAYCAEHGARAYNFTRTLTKPKVYA